MIVHGHLGIDIAATVSVEQQADKRLPAGWNHADLRMARPFGDAWIRKRRTAALVVPSVVTRREGNVLINPQHPDCRAIVAGKPEPVVWEARPFASHRNLASCVTAQAALRQTCNAAHNRRSSAALP